MNSPHVAEFASERYFEKLQQQNAAQQSPSHDGALESSVTASSRASAFILPLRDLKLADTDYPKGSADQKREKGRFFGIRQKVANRHSKSNHHEPDSSLALPSRDSTDWARKSIPFDQLLFALPNELQAEVLSSLSLPETLRLRLVSKSWHALVTVHEFFLARLYLKHHVPAYALRLYPVTDASDMTFHFVCSIWHRLHVAAKLSFLICEWITKDIFLRQSEEQRAAFASQHERMRRRLIPLLFTIFHFFESYRKLNLKHIVELGGRGLRHTPYTVNPVEKKIMDSYDDQTLLRVHEVFPLVISSFCRRLRPPTYVGRVERLLRGYLRERPSDEMHSAILCLGGLRQVERLWEIRGYNSRRAAVDVWYSGLSKENIAASSTKLRMGLKGFGRKKPTALEKPVCRSLNGDGGQSVKNVAEIPEAPHADGPSDLNWIFSTSLSASPPMGPLSTGLAQSLLDDLPVLQQIWLTTAEAMILDRGILPRTQDIKRNQQVMLDLIREDGMEDEDEWWYGRSMHESLRPPPSSMDDEAD